MHQSVRRDLEFRHHFSLNYTRFQMRWDVGGLVVRLLIAWEVFLAAEIWIFFPQMMAATVLALFLDQRPDTVRNSCSEIEWRERYGEGAELKDWADD